MHVKIPFKHTKSEALSRLKQALAEGRAKFSDKIEIHTENWNGDTLEFDVTVEGQRISGTLTVEESTYVLDAKLPFMLRLFESRIQREIEAQVKKMQ